jgi:hypothetical protein
MSYTNRMDVKPVRDRRHGAGNRHRARRRGLSSGVLERLGREEQEAGGHGRRPRIVLGPWRIRAGRPVRVTPQPA